MRFFNIICMLVLFQFCSHSDTTTDHYVDKNASGSNNGTSWTDAWESFAAIVWSSLEPGDILYISGGTDSTIYYETLHIPAIKGTAMDSQLFQSLANRKLRILYDPDHLQFF